MSPTSTEGESVEVETGPASAARANGDAPRLDDPIEVADEGELPEPEGLNEDEEGETVAPDGTEAADEPVMPDDPGAATYETEAWDETVAPDGAEAADEPVMLDDLEASTEEPDFDPLVTPPEMSQMLFVDVVLLLPATHPVVVLQEADAPFRELRIPVGGAEGIAIGYAARGVATPRPLTHELFARLLEEFGMTLDVVRITDVHGSAFSAEMVVSGPMGARLIDCRPSDAIALTLRQRLPAPIMASPMVLAIAGTDPLGGN